MLFPSAARISARALLSASVRTQRLAGANTALAAAARAARTTYSTAAARTAPVFPRIQRPEQPKNGVDPFKDDFRPPYNNIPTHYNTLWRPWTIDELNPVARAAYEQHGPDYVKHLAPDDAKKAVQDAQRRWKFETNQRNRLGGEHWFEVMRQIRPRWVELEAQILDGFRRRHAEITGKVEDMSVSIEESKSFKLRELHSERKAWAHDRWAKKWELEQEILRDLEGKKSE